jgi:6-pyruvoyltetrahydropterin/6-carboxytetrahydropterin synthase
MYGKCNNPYGHGHDYVLEVSVRGPVEECTGRVVDLGALDALVHCEVLTAFDHRDLNADVAEFAGVVPTTENLVDEVERRLRRRWDAAFPGQRPELDRIRIQETRRNAFEARL